MTGAFRIAFENLYMATERFRMFGTYLNCVLGIIKDDSYQIYIRIHHTNTRQ